MHMSPLHLQTPCTDGTARLARRGLRGLRSVLVDRTARLAWLKDRRRGNPRRRGSRLASAILQVVGTDHALGPQVPVGCHGWGVADPMADLLYLAGLLISQHRLSTFRGLGCGLASHLLQAVPELSVPSFLLANQLLLLLHLLRQVSSLSLKRLCVRLQICVRPLYVMVRLPSNFQHMHLTVCYPLHEFKLFLAMHAIMTQGETVNVHSSSLLP